MHSPIIPPHMADAASAFFTRKAGPDASVALSLQCGIPEGSSYLPIQKHTDIAIVVDEPGPPVIADAVLTQKKGLWVGVQVADCVPILLCDPVTGIVGAIHAGWRGTAALILTKTIGIAAASFGGDPADLLVAIGPSIRQCCYEVDRDVAEAVAHSAGQGDHIRQAGGKYFVDLAEANRIQALAAGVRSSNIWKAPECTFCNPDQFHSYRYSGGAPGRQAAFIGLLPKE